MGVKRGLNYYRMIVSRAELGKLIACGKWKYYVASMKALRCQGYEVSVRRV